MPSVLGCHFSTCFGEGLVERDPDLAIFRGVHGLMAFERFGIHEDVSDNANLYDCISRSAVRPLRLKIMQTLPRGPCADFWSKAGVRNVCPGSPFRWSHSAHMGQLATGAA